MDDARRVGGGEPVGDADEQLDDVAPAAVRRVRPFAGVLPPSTSSITRYGQSPSFGIKDGKDVRVVEARRRPGFADEALGGLGVRLAGRQQLHRDVAIESRIEGAVHDPHAAAADHLLEVIRPDPSSRQSCRLVVWTSSRRVRLWQGPAL